MTTLIPTFECPELFFGFVAPIGVDLRGCIDSLKQSLVDLEYIALEVKVTDIFKELSKFIEPDEELKPRPEAQRYTSYIKYGNKLRTVFEDDAALAVLTIVRIARLRAARKNQSINYSKVAFIIHQFKRKEEIDLFRSIYGKQFFQISVYSRRGARVEYLAMRFANTEHSANRNDFRAEAERIVQIDYNESGAHGQKLVKIFHDGDFIVNIDGDIQSTQKQIERFVKLIFGANDISPTKMEYAMFTAKAAALRTLDLSRQVGAAIFSAEGEIISLGSNEVPKAGGGTYWCDDPYDDREFQRGIDSNERRKKEILAELLAKVEQENRIDDPEIAETQFMDALEYGRIIHAEMSAIVDAARLGRATKDAFLFCTTFPCHMCAKHIVGAGIKRVVFLEPYPKSLVVDLHSDSVMIEGNDRGHYARYPAVIFEHFHGVSPRRYRELFERNSRKNKGEFRKWVAIPPQPNLNVTNPVYASFESKIVETVIPQYIKKAHFDDKVLDK